MAYQPFLIAPFGIGLDTDLEPWMAPPDAFQNIINGHIHHGVLEKRAGYRELGKLVHGHSTNFVISDISTSAPGNPGVVTITSTTGISNGDTIIIHDVVGMTEVNGNEYIVANKSGVDFELTDSDGNVDTSGFTPYASGGVVYFIPGLRTMGLQQHIDPQNVKELIAFDTKRACRYDATNDRFDPLDDADIFNGGNEDYIWADNWASTASSAAATIYRLYFTNGKALSGGLNGIRYYTGSSGTTTTSYAPLINSLNQIEGCKLIFAFKERLLLLHTFEGGRVYPQRVRWCQAQNPDATGTWDDKVAGKGGFVDASTGEQIISARALQNGILVFFTNSVWTLSPTPDPAIPFKWDRINDFRACDAKMGTVEYDRYVVALGVRGITATDGVETRRIDNRIEKFVTGDVNIDEFGKIFSARSYANRRTWILYPQTESDDSDYALILDDESSAFSKYDIDMNVLGYVSDVFDDYAAKDFTAANNLDWAAEDAGNETALSFFWAGNAELFIGGDTDGIVYTLEIGTDDDEDSISFLLESAAWAPYKDKGIQAQLGYIDFFIDTDPKTRFTVDFYKDNNDSPYRTQEVNCLPNLNYIAKITNAVAKSPASAGVTVTANQHGLSTGDEIYIYGAEGMVGINDQQFSITLVDANNFDIAIDATNFGTYTLGGEIVKREFYRTKTWKRAYAGGCGYQHRIKITSSGTQKPLRFHAFRPAFRPRGKRTL